MRGARSTFFGTFLGTPFRTGTFRSTFPGQGAGTSLDGRRDCKSRPIFPYFGLKAHHFARVPKSKTKSKEVEKKQGHRMSDSNREKGEKGGKDRKQGGKKGEGKEGTEGERRGKRGEKGGRKG